MLINLLTAIALFFVQPVFWLGLIVAVTRSQRRRRYERKHFNHAIYRESYEVKNYLTKGLIPGILLSLGAVIIGMTLTVEWIILYQLVVLLLFLFGERFIHPIFSFSITSLLLFLLPHIGLDTYTFSLPLVGELDYSFERSVFEPLSLSIFILIILLLFLSNWFLNKKAARPFSPEVYETKRGKLSVRYAANSLTVIPLLTIVPGNSFGNWFDWWPVFDVGAEQYSFVVLPIVTGFIFYLGSYNQETLREDLPRFLKISIILLAIGGLAVLYLAPDSLWIIFALALILGVGNYSMAHYKERKSETAHRMSNDGVKIIGIRPDSPASNMELKVGDTILDVNGKSIQDDEAFKRELADNRLYVHLRIQQPNGDITLKETPIYENDSYDLGIILFSHYTK